LGPVKKDALLQEVLDHETWTINLDEANESSEDPKWYRLYSAKNAFAMDSLRPAAWAKVIDRLVQNPDFFDLFYKSVVPSNFPPAPSTARSISGTITAPVQRDRPATPNASSRSCAT
jgi:hypothetical protein